MISEWKHLNKLASGKMLRPNGAQFQRSRTDLERFKRIGESGTTTHWPVACNWNAWQTVFEQCVIFWAPNTEHRAPVIREQKTIETRLQWFSIDSDEFGEFWRCDGVGVDSFLQSLSHIDRRGARSWRSSLVAFRLNKSKDLSRRKLLQIRFLVISQHNLFILRW